MHPLPQNSILGGRTLPTSSALDEHQLRKSEQDPVQVWLAEVPPNHLRSQPQELLTIAGVAVTGVWRGQLGEFYSAWSPYDAKLHKLT